MQFITRWTTLSLPTLPVLACSLLGSFLALTSHFLRKSELCFPREHLPPLLCPVFLCSSGKSAYHCPRVNTVSIFTPAVGRDPTYGQCSEIHWVQNALEGAFSGLGEEAAAILLPLASSWLLNCGTTQSVPSCVTGKLHPLLTDSFP